MKFLLIAFNLLFLSPIMFAEPLPEVERSSALTCPPTTSGTLEKVPTKTLQQKAAEAAKAYRDTRETDKSEYLKALQKFVILRLAKAEANRIAAEAIAREDREIETFRDQIRIELEILVGDEAAADLIYDWERKATPEVQEKTLKEFAIQAKTNRNLFTNLAKKKGLSDEQIAFAKNESFEFVEISVGEFMMGSPKDEEGRMTDETQRRVLLTKPFQMAKTEVTQLQWYLMMGSNPSYFGKRILDDRDTLESQVDSLNMNHPVENVSWSDAQEYILRLNEIDPKFNYRLPTEAEWEYAARAGTTSAYSFGDSAADLVKHAIYEDNSSDQTQSVALKKPNPKGLYDMHGNVWEWCEDLYEFTPKDEVDPKGSNSGGLRTIRGGSFNTQSLLLRSAYRNHSAPGRRNNNIGFRLVRTPK